MKSAKNYYNKDRAYKLLRKDLLKTYDQSQIERIFNKAEENLQKLYDQYPHVFKAEAMHVYDNILPRIAMYNALKEELPHTAMDIVDQAVRKNCTMIGNILHTMTAFPFMPAMFMKVFTWMAKEVFGTKAGFKQIIHVSNSNELSFDIVECPYCKYCLKCDCKELIHTFCDSDLYCYNNLSHIEFTRTKTLATGEDCCDFRLKIRKK